MMAFLSQHAGLIGLIFFFLIFCGIAVWAYLPKHKKKIESYRYIPLSENEDEHRKS